MTSDPPEILPPERDLAILHTPQKVRDTLRIFLWFDQRLARVVGTASEPMLAQIQLAWWRDMLSTPAKERPEGDVVLDGISRSWDGQEQALIACVDGWEHLLDDPPLSEDAAKRFARGRAQPFVALAEIAAPEIAADRVEASAMQWALVDAATHIDADQERAMFLQLASETPATLPLPRPLRGLAVLDALARRSLRRGGTPLMAGRGAAIAATRAAILGR